ncbi:expressed unknown protein [Seminavis robusta]|uniref:Uncharacterized protein n=1 Tax=Seminavis robusta TaxID=568900 RepID=A0A9N8E0Z9_9STRA|nr:expressed unknown protein [Seminavis robusta]|eukprot:Sro427_g140730.1 n/a (264) ;mRNA; r:60790-61581
MCKPLDDPQCATGTPNAALLTQQQEASATAATATTTGRNRTRKVRFGVSNIVQVARIGEDEDEKQSVWYNRQDFCLIRQEIGQVVEARAAKDWRCKDEDFYCVRGLEFLKLDEHTPSRKERRLCFAKNVMIFQCMSKNASCSSKKKSKGREQALAAYCARLSNEARSRARRWGVFDEEEARQVFYECRLIYHLNGKEFRMFAPTCSLQASMFQRSSRHDDDDDDDCDSVDSDDGELAIAPLYDVFSFDSLIRVISTVTTLVTS